MLGLGIDPNNNSFANKYLSGDIRTRGVNGVYGKDSASKTYERCGMQRTPLLAHEIWLNNGKRGLWKVESSGGMQIQVN